MLRFFFGVSSIGPTVGDFLDNSYKWRYNPHMIINGGITPINGGITPINALINR